MEWILYKLKEFAEGDMQVEEWERWWNEHQAAIEPVLKRRVYLLLKKRPLLAARELLAEHDIPFEQKQFQCDRCGALMFQVIPGETTVEEIVAFASRASFVGRDHILKWRWMSPGLHCPTGCIRESYPAPYTPSEEELIWREENLKTFDERHRLDMEERARNPWGEKVCTSCGKRLSTWADSTFGRCGYCRHPLEAPPTGTPVQETT